MKNQTLKQHLEKLRLVKKSSHHSLLHKIHREYQISRKTLFYIKEYGPHTHVAKTIIKESLKILLLASILSSFGGLALEHIKTIFVSLIPLTILLPTLNDMIGDYGTILSSRFSTMLHEGKVKKAGLQNPEFKELFLQILIISIITAVLSAAIALLISLSSGFIISGIIALKIFFIAVVDVILLVLILAFASITAGLYFFKKGEDPNNFLIPITTSLADFGNMIILTLLVILLF